MNSESESFMRENGYYLGRSLMMEEKEITSGGRMGSENYSHIVGSIKQIKDKGFTYAKIDQFNQKSNIQFESYNGKNMSTKTATYLYTVGRFGPDGVVDPVFKSNRKGMSSDIPLNIVRGFVEALSDLIGK